MKKRVKQEYTTEFKDRTLKLVISSDKPISQIADDLGIKSSTLYAWVNKAKQSKLQDAGNNTEELFNELKRLKKELAEVKEQRDILKKATAYFAKESQ
jgi:transposase